MATTISTIPVNTHTIKKPLASFILEEKNIVARTMVSVDCGESGYVYNQYVMYADGDRVVMYTNSKLGANTLECVTEGSCAMKDGMVTYTVDRAIIFSTSSSACATNAIHQMLSFGLRKMCNDAIRLDEEAFSKALSNSSDRVMTVMRKILSARHDK